jgi:putative nucleotidyltransferase with HDIG domain
VANILLLGGGRSCAAGVRKILSQDGHRVRRLRNAELWREIERETRPELIVSADDPGMVLPVAGRAGRGFAPPLLFVDASVEDRDAGLHLDDRLVDRIESPFMSEELLARVDALVRARRVVMRAAIEEPQTAAAPAAGSRAGRALRSFGERLTSVLGTRVPRFEKPLGPYLEVAARIADWADRRDVFEPGHAERVASLAAMIAEGLGLPAGESSALLRAAMLHDIGKVALPGDILRQTTPLREEQRRVIRTHPERGAALLRALDKDGDVAEAILYHHEQPDGAGYYGKSGESVPRTASILGVAEAYDAMTSTLLSEPLSSQIALERLEEQRGRKYDADCVDALVDALRPRARSIPLSPRR